MCGLIFEPSIWLPAGSTRLEHCHNLYHGFMHHEPQPILPQGIGNAWVAVMGEVQGGGSGWEGGTQQALARGISAAAALVNSQSTKPCRHLRWGRCYTTVLPTAQPSPTCKFQPTVQIYTTATSPEAALPTASVMLNTSP